MSLKASIFYLVCLTKFIATTVSIVFDPKQIEIYPLNVAPSKNCSQDKYLELKEKLTECERNVSAKLVFANPNLWTQSKLKESWIYKTIWLEYQIVVILRVLCRDGLWPDPSLLLTRLWPGYFPTWPEEIFFDPKRKKLLNLTFLGKFSKFKPKP